MATKRIIAAALAAAVFLCFSGCGRTEPPTAESAAGGTTAASEMEIALEQGMPDVRQLAGVMIEKAEEIQSLEQKVDMAYELFVTEDGERTMSIRSQTVMTSQVTKDPYVMKTDTQMELANTSGDSATGGDDASDSAGASGNDSAAGSDDIPGGEMLSLTSNMYAEKTGDNKLAVYTKNSVANDTAEAVWTKVILAMPGQKYDLLDADLFRSIESGEKEAVLEPDLETAAGKNCYVIHTVMDYDSASSELLSMLQQMGMPDEMITEDMIRDIRINMVMWVDSETGLPVMYQQDLTDVGNSLLNSIFMKALSPQGSTGENAEDQDLSIDYQFEFSDYTVVTSFTGFDTVDRIDIPEEARNAEEISNPYGSNAQEPGTEAAPESGTETTAEPDETAEDLQSQTQSPQQNAIDISAAELSELIQEAVEGYGGSIGEVQTER